MSCHTILSKVCLKKILCFSLLYNWSQQDVFHILYSGLFNYFLCSHDFFFIRIQLYACNFLACECLLFLECYLHILKIAEFCGLYSAFSSLYNFNAIGYIISNCALHFSFHFLTILHDLPLQIIYTVCTCAIYFNIYYLIIANFSSVIIDT